MSNNGLIPMGSQPYHIDIITDTLFYTIAKVVVSGEIRDPTLLLASDALIGSTLQSAIAQFGGGLPNLPDIHCVSSQVSTQNQKCRCCDWSNRHRCQQYGNGCLFKKPGRPSLKDQANVLSAPGGNLNTPEVITQNDLVTFLPPEMSRRYTGPSNPDIQISQSIPLLYGMSASSGHISYILIASDSLDDLIKVLNKNTEKRLIGSWRQECDISFRYYYNTILTKVITVQDKNRSVLDVITEISKLPIRGRTGRWTPSYGNNYYYNQNGYINYLINVRREDGDLNSLLYGLNTIKQEKQTGQWVNDGQTCNYTFKYPMVSTNILAKSSEIKSALVDAGWELSGLQNGVYTFSRDDLLLRLTPTQTLVNVVGNKNSVDTFVNDIVIPFGWESEMIRNWNQGLVSLKIEQRQPGIYSLMGNLDTINNFMESTILKDNNWIISEIKTQKVETIIIPEEKDTILKALRNKGWIISNNPRNCFSVNKGPASVEISQLDQFSEVFGDIDSIRFFTEDVIAPNQWEYSQKTNQEDETIQILYNGGTEDKVRILGNDVILDSFYQAYPELFNEPETQKLELLVVHAPYPDVLEYLSRKWNVIYTNDESSSFSHPSLQNFNIEVFGGQKTTTIWGFTDAINYLKESIRNIPNWYNYETEVPGDQAATIFRLTNNITSQSEFLSTYQVIGPKEMVENICQNLADPKRCQVNAELAYTSLTAERDTESLINILVNYDYGTGTRGWLPDGKNQMGCGHENLYRFYRLSVGGMEIATPYFIYLFNIPSNGSGTLASYTKIEGEQQVLDDLIKPVLRQFQINSINAGDDPVVPRQMSLNIGKVVGLTGNIKKMPNCYAPTRIAITNINWSLDASGAGQSNNSDRQYIELLWETDLDQENANDIAGQTAFIFSGTGSYGLGSLNSGNGNTLVDGGGQPGIPNNAFPNPTGNILFRTKGNVFGTFTIKFYKYSGYYNCINFFDNATNNLQSAIQANELIQRDWIRVYKQRREEDILVPLLVELERNNRTALRPSPTSNGVIIHTITGEITLTLPRDITKQTVNNPPIKTLELQIQIRRLLADYLNLTDNLPSIALVNEFIVPPGDKRNVILEYTINTGSVSIIQAKNWLENARQFQTKINNLNQDGTFQDFAQTYQYLDKVQGFQITNQLSAYVLGQTSNSYVKNDYNNVARAMVDELALVRLITELDIRLRDNLRPTTSAVPDTFGAYQQIGGLNAANQSRWLETQVKRLIYGSEAPMPINLPTPEKPYYTFPDGSPVAGFLQNAFASGYNIPVNPFPPFVSRVGANTVPQNANIGIPVQNPPFQYGNTQIRANSHNMPRPNNLHHNHHRRDAVELANLLARHR